MFNKTTFPGIMSMLVLLMPLSLAACSDDAMPASDPRIEAQKRELDREKHELVRQTEEAKNRLDADLGRAAKAIDARKAELESEAAEAASKN